MYKENPLAAGHIGACGTHWSRSDRSLTGGCLSVACPCRGAFLLEGMTRCVLQVPWPGQWRRDNVYSSQEELGHTPQVPSPAPHLGSPSPFSTGGPEGLSSKSQFVAPSAVASLPISPLVHSFRVSSLPTAIFLPGPFGLFLNLTSACPFPPHTEELPAWRENVASQILLSSCEALSTMFSPSPQWCY